jgi:hypothetical protein
MASIRQGVRKIVVYLHGPMAILISVPSRNRMTRSIRYPTDIRLGTAEGGIRVRIHHPGWGKMEPPHPTSVGPFYGWIPCIGYYLDSTRTSNRTIIHQGMDTTSGGNHELQAHVGSLLSIGGSVA